MTIRRYAAICLTLMVIVASAIANRATVADNKNMPEDREHKLIDVLKSSVPSKDKAIPCKQLAIYGTKDAVPALAALLTDKELASWARIALEAIPDPAADEAFREALDKLYCRLLVGVINSIGVHRDAKAVDTLVQRLRGSRGGHANPSRGYLFDS